MTRAREWLVFSHTEPAVSRCAAQLVAACDAGGASLGTPGCGMAHGRGRRRWPQSPVQRGGRTALPGHAAGPTPPRPPVATPRPPAWARPCTGCSNGSAAQPTTGQRPAPSGPPPAGLPPSPSGLPPAAAAEVLALATRVLQSPDCQRFFNGPALRWAGNEVPVPGGRSPAHRPPGGAGRAGSHRLVGAGLQAAGRSGRCGGLSRATAALCGRGEAAAARRRSAGRLHHRERGGRSCLKATAPLPIAELRTEAAPVRPFAKGCQALQCGEHACLEPGHRHACAQHRAALVRPFPAHAAAGQERTHDGLAGA
jgi:hypothetical protein